MLDQNIERRFASSLRDAGHDVHVAGVDEPPGLADTELLNRAYEQARILVTKDRDFGDLAIRHRQPHAGVIYLRVRAQDFATKWELLATVLKTHADEMGQFLVVTDRQVRVRPTR